MITTKRRGYIRVGGVQYSPLILDYNSNGKDVSMRVAGVSQLQQTGVKFSLYSSTTSVLTTGNLIQTSF